MANNGQKHDIGQQRISAMRYRDTADDTQTLCDIDFSKVPYKRRVRTMGIFPRFAQIEAERFAAGDQIASARVSITEPKEVYDFESEFYDSLVNEADAPRGGIENVTRYQVTILSEHRAKIGQLTVLPDLVCVQGETFPDEWSSDPEGKLWNMLENKL